MKKIKMGVGTKVFAGFIALIVIGSVIGIAGFLSLNKVSSAGNVREIATEVQTKVLEARIFEKDYLLKKDEASYGRLMKCLDELAALSTKLKKGMEAGAGFGEIGKAQQAYREAMAEIKRLEEDDAQALKDIQVIARDITAIAEGETSKASTAVREEILRKNAKSLKDYSFEAVRNITAVGYDVLRFYHEKGLPREDALEAIRNLHFAGKNYFFVVQEDLILVAHGSDRKLEGKDFGQIQDKKTGKTFMSEVVGNAIKEGESFTEYYWNKPGAGDAVFPKVTYARYFKPWNLVLCAGVYIDDIEAQVAETGKALEEGINRLQQADSIRPALLQARLDATYFFAFGTNAEKLPEDIGRLKQLGGANAELRQKADTYLEQFNRRVRNSAVREKDVNQIAAAADKITKIAGDVGSYAMQIFATTAHGGKRFISIFILIATLAGLGLAALLARAIIKPITRAIKGIVETSEQVASASGQVSSASQQLAEGASEQAASIEETSSALEEMTSMTKQNAENASQANELTLESGRIVEEANETMGRLTVSMSEISTASEETQKIIKTIDEIAFQTNLLALNAAVEAARAGEAGAGFAVVADEVRNLAMRAAEAAKNTALMIESTVAKVKEGSSLVEKTNQDFHKVAGCVNKSGALVGEIAAASREQAQGIGQINSAIAEMDKVVQQNSANAEESASASQQMNAQAKNLEEYLQGLVALVGGDAGKDTGKRRNPEKSSSPVKKTLRASIASIPSLKLGGRIGKKANGKGGAPNYGVRSGKDPEQLIPFHDDGMDAF